MGAVRRGRSRRSRGRPRRRKKEEEREKGFFRYLAFAHAFGLL